MRPSSALPATPDGQGYWLIASDGGVFAFGDAGFMGSMGGRHLNAPIVGVADADGGGYWLVASDGGVFAFGDATFMGSMGGQPLNAPVAGIASPPNGAGYWLVGADGGVFTFGIAGFFGSVPGQGIVGQPPVVGMSRSPSGAGYWLVGAGRGRLQLRRRRVPGGAHRRSARGLPFGDLHVLGLRTEQRPLVVRRPLPATCHHDGRPNRRLCRAGRLWLSGRGRRGR